MSEKIIMDNTEAFAIMLPDYKYINSQTRERNETDITQAVFFFNLDDLRSYAKLINLDNYLIVNMYFTTTLGYGSPYRKLDIGEER